MTPILVILLQTLLVAVPLLYLARYKRVFPHQPLLYATLVPVFLSIALVWSPELLTALVLIDIGLAVLVLVDLGTLPRYKVFKVERTSGRTASLRAKHTVSLLITNQGRRPRFIRVRDDVPHELNPEPAEFRIQLAGRSRAESTYIIRPSRRGAFTLKQCHLLARSMLGFWQRHLDYPVETAIHVYPDLVQLSQYAVMARLNRLSLLGVRKSRRLGGDNEFERLRDYTLDDNYKHIEWRSTARRGKLTVKDFQANQSQRLIFLVDCGRMMTNQAAGLSLLDHSLNAMLLLSYVALSRGDQVGLLTFSDEIHGYVPPGGGSNQMNRLLHESFDRFPRLVESRYDRAFLYLGSHCRKRSLVVLITNVIDEVNGNQIESYLRALVGRHLPLGVLLRDRRVFEYADVQNPQGPALYRAAAAAEILLWRHQVLTDLAAKGVLSMDVFPEDLTAPLINRYLDIKARHLL